MHTRAFNPGSLIMGSVQAKSLDHNDVSNSASGSTQSDEYLAMPTTFKISNILLDTEAPRNKTKEIPSISLESVVDRIHIEGLKRTRTDYILPELTKILEAQTFGEVIAFTLEARDNLNNLEIFKDVGVLIDTSQGPTSSPNGYDITLIVSEKRLVTSNIGSQVGNNEGTLVFGLKANNLLGRGEGLKTDLGFGTKTKSSYQVGFSKPVAGNHDKSFYVGAHKSMTDVPQSSYKEAAQGINFNYTFPSIVGLHSLGWEGTWRELTGIDTNASFKVREEAGHSLKSSLLHTLLVDTRDHPSFPTEGSLFKLTQELAGIGGDVQFIKNNVEVQENIELSTDIVLSWCVQAGLMNTLVPNSPSKIHDRFFLGGPLSVRGFQMKGIGPRDEGDSLGGEAYWAAGVHLYTPLPFRPGQGSFGDHIKTHVFVNSGNLSTIDSSLPWKQRVNPLTQNLRWSCGVGLVLLLGVARVEFNYCIPRGVQPSDGINPGLQVGVGVNFL